MELKLHSMQRISYFIWVGCLPKCLNQKTAECAFAPSLYKHPGFPAVETSTEEGEEGCSWISFQHTLRSCKVLPVPMIFLFPWCPSHTPIISGYTEVQNLCSFCTYFQVGIWGPSLGIQWLIQSNLPLFPYFIQDVNSSLCPRGD